MANGFTKNAPVEETPVSPDTEQNDPEYSWEEPYKSPDLIRMENGEKVVLPMPQEEQERLEKERLDTAKAEQQRQLDELIAVQEKTREPDPKPDQPS